MTTFVSCCYMGYTYIKENGGIYNLDYIIINNIWIIIAIIIAIFICCKFR